MRRAGIVESGLAAARQLVVDAREADYAPLSAEALLHLAALERQAGEFAAAEQHLRDALAEALRGHADALAGEAAVELVRVVGREPEGWVQAEAWAQLAGALLERAGGDPDGEAGLLVQRADMLAHGGRLPEAPPLLRRALARIERAHGPDDARVLDLSTTLADALARLGDRTRAREEYGRALAIAERTVGADHPKCAAIVDALGRIELAEGRAERAVIDHERALAIRRAAFGDDAIELALSLQGLAHAEITLGRDEPARAHLVRAIALVAKHR